MKKAYEEALEVVKQEKEKVIRWGSPRIGYRRHEARRIDNQLRGRSGRQGDPGSSRFYLSLEDDLLRIFGSERISTLWTGWELKKTSPSSTDLLPRPLRALRGKWRPIILK